MSGGHRRRQSRPWRVYIHYSVLPGQFLTVDDTTSGWMVLSARGFCPHCRLFGWNPFFWMTRHLLTVEDIKTHLVSQSESLLQYGIQADRVGKTKSQVPRDLSRPERLLISPDGNIRSTFAAENLSCDRHFSIHGRNGYTHITFWWGQFNFW